VKLRLGDEVTFLEEPFLGRPGEKKVQEGFVHFFDLDDGSSDGDGDGDDDADGAGERGPGRDKMKMKMKAFCAYKKYPGYVSKGLDLGGASLMPRRRGASNQVAAGAGARSTTGSTISSIGGSSDGSGSSSGSGSFPTAPEGKQPAGAANRIGGSATSNGGIGGGIGLSSPGAKVFPSSSSSASASSSSSAAAASASASASSDRSVQSWGGGKCKHVLAGDELNHKDGKVRRCISRVHTGVGVRVCWIWSP